LRRAPDRRKIIADEVPYLSNFEECQTMVSPNNPNGESAVDAAKAEIIANAKTARKKLRYLLEKEAEKDEMDIGELLKYY
jgi:hypothetical protein